MALIGKLNRKLAKLFGGIVHAELREGCLYLTGALNNWDDIVRAGQISVNKKHYTVVNDIEFDGGNILPTRTPLICSNALEGKKPDILIIGGGIIGCAVARELKRYQLDVMLVEKEHDVALHASGRNDGMILPGLDLRGDQLKKKYNDEGSRLYPQVCKELDVPFNLTGQYLCFTNKWFKPAVIASTLLYWKKKGISAEFVNRNELLKHEPYLSEDVKFALFFPNTGVVCPYGLTIAYAENAADNGVDICLDTAVFNIDVKNGIIKSVLTNHGRIFPKLVINAAGVFAEEIAYLANDRFFSIHPRRSTSTIFDKKAGHFVKTVVSAVSGMGVNPAEGCIIHTANDNLLIRSAAAETYHKEDFSTDRKSINTVLEKQQKIITNISKKDIITYYTGITSVTYEDDFIVSFGKFTRNIIHAAGIQSPGLTAAPAIAIDVSKMAAFYLKAFENTQFNPIRKGIVRAACLPDEQRDALIKKDPNYGVIICRCEEISRGEVLDALRRSVPCDTVDGVMRRVRSGMGRCQGSFCGPHVAQIIAAEKKIPITEVKKMSDNSRILFGSKKERHASMRSFYSEDSFSPENKRFLEDKIC